MAPWSEAGAHLPRSPSPVHAPRCPRTGPTLHPRRQAQRAARRRRGPLNGALIKLRPLSRAGTAVSARSRGGRPARGRFLLASRTAYLGRDPRVKRGARERRRHEGRGRREAATARRTAGDSAGRRRGGRPSAAAQCPARLLPARPGDGAGQAPGGEAPPSRAGRAGGAATRTEPGRGRTAAQDRAPRARGRGGAGARGRTATLPSEANQQGVGEPRSHFKRKESAKTGAGTSFHKAVLPSSRGSSGPQNPDSVSRDFNHLVGLR